MNSALRCLQEDAVCSRGRHWFVYGRRDYKIVRAKLDEKSCSSFCPKALLSTHINKVCTLEVVEPDEAGQIRHAVLISRKGRVLWSCKGR